MNRFDDSKTTSSAKMLRCAIYTRKSNEEGLDQVFNSLDAQREAGLDYIRSQKHEGWHVIDTHYDDGGYSGGNTQRPALQKLMDDIDRGRVDVVVVYKVDRLSRSLHDFAQIMQLFDERQVSFVSVTQQFNTTNSMGRLTLNMLLSFAQFEREVTGERIRDKIAATKKKGMWVGGQPPLGYRLKDGLLEIIPIKAELIRRIVGDYLSRPSLVEIAATLNAEGHTTKHWVSSKGREHGGKPLTPKYLYRILTNPLYVGRIIHNDKDWKGLHPPIIERSLWDKLQKAIDTQERKSRYRWDQPHLLKGKLRTFQGYAMSPTSVHRPSKVKSGKHLVRYYVSQKGIHQGYAKCPIKTINARHLDELVSAVVLDHLGDELGGNMSRCDLSTMNHWIRAVIRCVILAPDSLSVELDADELDALRLKDWPAIQAPSKNAGHPKTPMPVCLYKPIVRDCLNIPKESKHGAPSGKASNFRGQSGVVLELGVEIKRLDGRRVLLSPEGRDLVVSSQPEPKDHIVRAIGQAYYWRDVMLKDGLNRHQLAERLGITYTIIRKYLPLIYLSPDLLKASLTGRLPQSVTLQKLLDAAKTLDWLQQAAYLDGV